MWRAIRTSPETGGSPEAEGRRQLEHGRVVGAGGAGGGGDVRQDVGRRERADGAGVATTPTQFVAGKAHPGVPDATFATALLS